MADHSHDHHDRAPVAEHHHHDHAHGHGHHHHDDDGDTYFIDQLCMVGLSGAFGVICLCLYFWQRKMLANMLGEQFHLAVLLAGIALTVLSFTRAAILWRQSRDPNFRHGHDHSHDHEHDHAHEHAIQAKPPHAHGVQALPLATPLPEAIPTADTHQHRASCGHEHAPGDMCGHDHHHHHHHVHDHAHDHDEADHDHGWAPWRYVVILVPIIFFLLGLPSKPLAIEGFQRAQGIDFEQLLLIFAGIVYEALPFIVAGVIVAGLLEEFVPQQAIAKIIPRNRVLAIMLGAILGLVFPMCECGIIVVMKRLLRKGLPLSVCVAYMLAGPVINGIVMWTTYVAFDQPDPSNNILGGPWQVIGWRVGLSYLVACVTALIVDWQWNKHGAKLLHASVARGLKQGMIDPDAPEAPRFLTERVDNITRTALHDFVDILAFLILGAMLAVIGRFVLKQNNVQGLFEQSPAIAILLMMGIAVLFCLCSEADAFVAANFPLYWPPASKIAFLVLGPMLDLKLYLMYTRVFRPRLIFTIIASVVTQVFVYTMILDAIDDTPRPPPYVEPVYLSPEQDTHLRSIGLGKDSWSQLVHLGVAFNPPPSGKGEYWEFKRLYQLAEQQDERDRWDKEKVVEVRGQFAGYPGSQQVFKIARYKVGCCVGDGTELGIVALARESVSGHTQGAWVRVTGKVVFRERAGRGYETVLLVSKATDVVPCDPDPNPYIK